MRDWWGTRSSANSQRVKEVDRLARHDFSLWGRGIARRIAGVSKKGALLGQGSNGCMVVKYSLFFLLFFLCYRPPGCTGFLDGDGSWDLGDMGKGDLPLKDLRGLGPG